MECVEFVGIMTVGLDSGYYNIQKSRMTSDVAAVSRTRRGRARWSA